MRALALTVDGNDTKGLACTIDACSCSYTRLPFRLSMALGDIPNRVSSVLAAAR